MTGAAGVEVRRRTVSSEACRRARLDRPRSPCCRLLCRRTHVAPPEERQRRNLARVCGHDILGSSRGRWRDAQLPQRHAGQRGHIARDRRAADASACGKSGVAAALGGRRLGRTGSPEACRPTRPHYPRSPCRRRICSESIRLRTQSAQECGRQQGPKRQEMSSDGAHSQVSESPASAPMSAVRLDSPLIP